MDSQIANYEAHQPPLAYLLLAIPDRLLARYSLVVRVRILRCFCGFAAVALLAAAAGLLCVKLNTPEPYRSIVLLLTFSSQMFYASTVHICNDWLAIPLASWVIVTGISFYANSSVPGMLWFSLTLAMGLLTKAYFLAFTPLYAALVILAITRRKLTLKTALLGTGVIFLLAGPWYVRNVRTYQSLTGTPEDIAGIRLPQVLKSVSSVQWTDSIGYMARASVWTGNNQFDTFSHNTINLILLLLCVSGAIYFIDLKKRGPVSSDVINLAAIALFMVAVAYATVVSFAYTQGASPGASPWYMQVLLVPMLALVVRGLSSQGIVARAATCLQIWLWTYVILLTYSVKLIPRYGGYFAANSHVASVAKWYLTDRLRRHDYLSTVTLGAPLLL